MQVSLQLLRAFEAAARTGSFQDAAVELHLSPSAVSHAIRKLEQALGTVLFERDGRRVRLSSDGHALMRHVGPAFDDIRRGVDFVSTRQEIKGTLAYVLDSLHYAPRSFKREEHAEDNLKRLMAYKKLSPLKEGT